MSDRALAEPVVEVYALEPTSWSSLWPGHDQWILLGSLPVCRHSGAAPVSIPVETQYVTLQVGS